MGIRISLNDGSYFFSENPKKDLLDRLIEKTLLAGHMLSFDEASKDPKMVQPNQYAFYYGSFMEAAQIAWTRRDLPTKPPEAPKPPVISKPQEVLPKPQPKRQRGGAYPRYTPEKVKSMLIAYYERTGRLPTQTDAISNPELPSWVTMTKLLGPKCDWEKLLSLPPKELKPAVEPSMSQPDDSPPADVNNQKPDEEETVSSAIQEEGITVDASRHQENGIITVEVKISLPDREKPILITLTV